MKLDEIQWIVNDLGELGVKVGNVFAFLYKGQSYVGGTKWRPVYKREFGECCHPPDEPHPDRGRRAPDGAYSFGNVEDWQPLPEESEAEITEFEVKLPAAYEAAAKIKISLDDPETRAVWETCQRAKAEVASWPAWKRGGPVVEAACAPPEGECWCSACEDDRLVLLPPMEALISRRFIVCPKCGNKRCPKATHHDYRCTNSNESGQVGVEETATSATHAVLDRVAVGATFVRRISSTQTAECPMWSSMEGQYIETDEQLRARMTRHQDRGDGFTHHDEDDCASRDRCGHPIEKHSGATGRPCDQGRCDECSIPKDRRPSALSVAPNWADEHIAALRRGETVTFHPCGKSMEPLVMHGQRVTVEPYGYQWATPSSDEPRVGDIVLVTVGTRNPFTGELTPRQYLHKIVVIREAGWAGREEATYQIGNNRGRINGWVGRSAIHGRMVR